MEKQSSALIGTTVLITGGTGSFGRTMAQYLRSRSVAEIRIFSRDEAKQHDLRTSDPNAPNSYYIGDVRDRASVENAMVGVDYVFHAAALKQVPSCEFFPSQAIHTNIVGSSNVIESAIHAGVKSVVCLSTDKAVFPINAMGMTKALMEKVAQAAARRCGLTGTTISCVRYGNVMCSRGSVIPLFINQIKQNKALTLTAPEMTRFLMPLRDAVSLVEFALANARSGDIFVKKAPAATMQTLADTVMELFEYKKKIQVIGTRHGEKEYETLATSEELRDAEDLKDYYRIRMDSRDLDYSKYFVEGDDVSVDSADYTSHSTEQLDNYALGDLLLSLPEVQSVLDYSPSESWLKTIPTA